jgi:UDP-N-acetyl-D-mannosaminuronic acid transferase (WecB/TagA/CpsF family)
MKGPFYLHGVKIFPVGIEEALQEVIQSIPKKKGDYFCFENIHVVMESQKDTQLKEALNNAAGNFPDGMGVAWALKFLGNNFEGRVWMQRAYLEWFYRMPQQPKKTAYRMSLVPGFIFRTLLQFINNGQRKF